MLAALFGLAYPLGRVVHEATDVLIEVNPRHVASYQRVSGFAEISRDLASRRKGRVERAPVGVTALERVFPAAVCETLAERTRVAALGAARVTAPRWQGGEPRPGAHGGHKKIPPGRDLLRGTETYASVRLRRW